MRLDRDGFIGILSGVVVLALIALVVVGVVYLMFGLFTAILAGCVFAGMLLLFIPLPIVPDIYRVVIGIALIGIPILMWQVI
jgi:hypothetical protein